MEPRGFPDAPCLGTAKIPIYALVQKVKVTARLSVVRFERLPSLNPKGGQYGSKCCCFAG